MKTLYVIQIYNTSQKGGPKFLINKRAFDKMPSAKEAREIGLKAYQSRDVCGCYYSFISYNIHDDLINWHNNGYLTDFTDIALFSEMY